MKWMMRGWYVVMGLVIVKVACKVWESWNQVPWGRDVVMWSNDCPYGALLAECTQHETDHLWLCRIALTCVGLWLFGILTIREQK
jgi:hypothetical protein